MVMVSWFINYNITMTSQYPKRSQLGQILRLLTFVSTHLIQNSLGFLSNVETGSILMDSLNSDMKRLHFGSLPPQFISISSSSCLSLAKTPPKSMFNLQEIERIEKELDEQHKISLENPDESFDDDDEHDLSDESATFYEFQVCEKLHDSRIDAALAEFMPNLSRSQCASLVDDGCVSILQNGTVPRLIDRKSTRVVLDSVIQVLYKQLDIPVELKAQDIPLEILYEDDHMIVLNKHAGMVVHPAVGNWDGTIVNALAYYLSNKSPYGPGEFLFNSSHPTDATRSEMTIQGKEGEVMAFRPGIVHRLDKGTSGVLVVAKTHQALAILSAFFARRQVQKTYLAITIGNPGKNVVIDKPIGRHPLHRQKMRVVPELSQRVMRDELHASSRKGMGRRAISHVQTLRFDSKLSVCQVRIETGRTHQIRVHLQDRKTPIYGDDIYGIPDWNKRLSKSYDIHRPLLHAHKLEINHPIHGHKMVFQAPMPKDMSLVAQSIWNDGIDERPELFTI